MRIALKYRKAPAIIIITAAFITYLITMILIFDKFPSLNQIWIGINNNNNNYVFNIYDYNESDPFDKLSYDIIEPWLHVKARIEHKKILSNNGRNRNKQKYSPWNRKCPPSTTMQILHDHQLNENYYTPSKHYVNFTNLKLKFYTFLSNQEALNNNKITLESFNKNILNNKKLKQCKYKNKVFGIGLFKTGTTSLNLALSYLGYIDNRKTSIYKWYKRYPCNYGHWYLILRHYYDLMNSLININNHEIYNDILIRSQDSYNFGDFPMLYFWPFFDSWYPNSKYILTIRSSTAIFVNSMMRFCVQLMECMQFIQFNNNNNSINIGEYKWNKYDEINGIDLANYIAMIYELHNERIIQYFNKKNKLNDLLILNIDQYQSNKNKNQWKDIMDFLGCNNETIQKYAKYPHVNPTKNEEFVILNLLPNNYKLNWKQYFQNKIAIMRTQHEPYRKIWFEYQDYNYYDLV